MKTFHKFLFLFLLAMQICFAQWVKTNGPEYFQIDELAVSGSNLFASAELNNDFGIFLSTNQGSDWIEISNGLPEDRYFGLAAKDNGSGTLVFTGFLDGEGVYISTDSGAHWTAINNGLPFDTISQSYPQISSLIASNTKIFAGGYDCDSLGCHGRVYVSSDNGADWQETNFSGQGGLVAFTTDGNNLFAGSNEMGGEGGVFLTKDDGASWTNLLNIAVVDIAVCGNNILAIQQIGYWGRIYYEMHKSTDNGATWSLINSAPVYGGCFLETEEHFFYGNGGGKVFISSDFGTTWENVDSGLTTPYNYINSLVTDNTYLFAGTQDGVWRRPLSEMITEIEDVEQLPTEFLLSQNYPNPFNPTTSISYSIPEYSYITIKVFDILGNEIETLVNEEKPAGRYELTWNAVNYPSGIYFYKLQAGSFAEMKKMILLK